MFIPMIAGEFNDYNITEKKHLDRQLEEKRNNSNPLKGKQIVCLHNF